MRPLPLLLLGIALLCPRLPAQSPAEPAAPPAPASSPEKATLTTFDLEFPGGTPADLVRSIEQAMGRPVNVVIPEEHANWRFPPVKMSGINVEQLFKALTESSLREEEVSPGVVRMVQAGIHTAEPPPHSDETIWFVRVAGRLPPGFEPPESPQKLRPQVYPLKVYLENGLTVDDITTAIQTGWRMLGEATARRELAYHEETQLLIVIGDGHSISTVAEVLSALEPGRWTRVPKKAEAKTP